MTAPPISSVSRYLIVAGVMRTSGASYYWTDSPTPVAAGPLIHGSHPVPIPGGVADWLRRTTTPQKSHHQHALRMTHQHTKVLQYKSQDKSRCPKTQLLMELLKSSRRAANV